METGYSIETKYALTLQNVKYPDVEFTLAYIQPYIVYDDSFTTGMSMVVLLECMVQNVQTIDDTIDYCNAMGYEDAVIQSLHNFGQALYSAHGYIKDKALKYLEAYEVDDFASCVKYMIEVQAKYWELFYVIGSFKNPDGTNRITVSLEFKEE